MTGTNMTIEEWLATKDARRDLAKAYGHHRWQLMSTETCDVLVRTEAKLRLGLEVEGNEEPIPEEHQIKTEILLNEEQWEVFQKLVEDPPAPTEALIDLMRGEKG